MPNYRRRYEAGGFVFLTIVTYSRKKIFASKKWRHLLHQAIEMTQNERPWEMQAIVLLPEHLHMLWKLPENDHDYSTRINLFKKRFTKAYLAEDGMEAAATTAQKSQRRRGVWQPRFWEHTIRDARDLKRHLDYIHVNPVKHGLVELPCDWEWSSFHRYVNIDEYTNEWCGNIDLPGQVEYFLCGCE